MTIPALGLRLNRNDCTCDGSIIYMDAQPLAIRPATLSNTEWDILCRFLCGVAHHRSPLIFGSPAFEPN
jgi:hypothetical protein